MIKLHTLLLSGLVAGTISGCATTGSDTNLTYKKSLPIGFQPWGVMSVTSDEGYPTRTGNSSIRFEVRDGDCARNDVWSDCDNDRQRHEFTTKGTSGDVWFNWSLYIPEDFPSLYPSTVTLGQFHQRSGPNPPFLFQVSNKWENQKAGYRIDRQQRGGTSENKPVMQDEEMRGKWSDILVHANFRADYQGFFRIYINGETVPRYQYSGSTIDSDGGAAYFKFGIYQSFISRYLEYAGEGAKTPTQVVYYDDVFTSPQCTKAAIYFDCEAIEQYEATLPAPSPPATYKRDETILYWRYSCLEKQLIANDTTELMPSSNDIRTLGRELKDFDSYVSHFKLRQILGAEVVNAHKEDLLHLVNFQGTTEEYCASL
ncbi:heparin lyase I family protein [Rhodanobacter aciditrophus]|uniref:Heparin lyase I family protein n=1 Tax=Rhodanobacter aciditrophus TaxID=1623218 RepID=A0ABW4AZV1_9GAMM